MHLVVGSNILAWLLAIGLKKFDKSKCVLVANIGSHFGGNSQSFKFQDIYVDRGMQTFYDSGVVWADEIIREALIYSGTEFNQFKWPDHDPCLVWHHGKLTETVYPIHKADWSIYDYIEKFKNLKDNNIDNDSLERHLTSRFGSEIWSSILESIAKKFTIGELSDLSIVSLAPIPLDRVIASQIPDELLARFPELWDRIGFHDNINIPKENYKQLSTIYPKYGGIKSLIDSLIALAEKYGVVIKSDVSLSDIAVVNKKIQFYGAEPDSVYWTIPNKHLLSFFDVGKVLTPPMPISGSLVVAYCSSGFNVSKSHYLLSYGEDPIFRITFYGSLAGKHANSYVTVELLQAPNEFVADELLKFFRTTRLIDENAECIFSSPTPSPWPISFSKGYTAQRADEERVLKENIMNLVPMNSNPANSSIMQTPTLSDRLRSISLDEKQI